MKILKNSKLLGWLGQAKGYVACHVSAKIAVGAVALSVIGGGGTVLVVTQMNKQAEIQQVEAPAGVTIEDSAKEDGSAGNDTSEQNGVTNGKQNQLSDGESGVNKGNNDKNGSGKKSGNNKKGSDTTDPVVTAGIPVPIPVNPIVPEPVKPPVVKAVQTPVATGSSSGSSSSGSSDDNYIIGEGPNGPVHIGDIDLDHVNVDE